MKVFSSTAWRVRICKLRALSKKSMGVDNSESKSRIYQGAGKVVFIV
jgi:hypothetical protein